MAAKSFKEIKVYKLAFEQAMDIFATSKNFPREETYSLTGQIRKDSRSVNTNLAEAYRKKNILHTLFLKFLILMRKTRRLMFGLTSHSHPMISIRTSTSK